MTDIAPALDDDTFIHNTFRAMLRRAPNEREIADWRWGLYQGQSRAAMIASLVASEEFAGVLSRSPPRAGTGGFSTETIQAIIRWSLDTAAADRGAHITRFAMYQALRDHFAALDAPGTTALAISGSKHLGQVLGLQSASYTEADYPAISVLSLPYADASFDFCISDQVLEHIEGDPFVAFAESVRVVRPGGYVCHTTCFINHIHQDPRDFWRFTPDSLRLLATHANCETTLLGGWGNREAWALVEAGFRFERIPLDQRHPLHALATRNEPEWPISVWIVARRPS